jgi:hypothetical protein
VSGLFVLIGNSISVSDAAIPVDARFQFGLDLHRSLLTRLRMLVWVGKNSCLDLRLHLHTRASQSSPAPARTFVLIFMGRSPRRSPLSNGQASRRRNEYRGLGPPARRQKPMRRVTCDDTASRLCHELGSTLQSIDDASRLHPRRTTPGAFRRHLRGRASLADGKALSWCGARRSLRSARCGPNACTDAHPRWPGDGARG